MPKSHAKVPWKARKAKNSRQRWDEMWQSRAGQNYSGLKCHILWQAIHFSVGFWGRRTICPLWVGMCGSKNNPRSKLHASKMLLDQSVAAGKCYRSKCRRSKMLQGQSVAVVNVTMSKYCSMKQYLQQTFFGWTFCAGQSVVWSFCGRT
jgi:hypothetical protein